MSAEGKGETILKVFIADDSALVRERLAALLSEIKAIELISHRKIVAITLNSEGLDAQGIQRAASDIEKKTGLPALDPLTDDLSPLVESVRNQKAIP